MAFETNTQIDLPSFAIKLRSEFPTKHTFGTGFVVDYNDRSWLFTCWHNIGPTRADNTVDLTGELTAAHIGFVNSDVRLNLAERCVVGAIVDGEPLDVAAIELAPHEKPSAPWFEAKRELTLDGFELPPSFQLGGHDGGEAITVPITRHYLWQGFPGRETEAPPVTFRAFDFPGSRSRHPWMLRYTPGGRPGASGCPIQQLEGNRAWIAGIHVHYHSSSEERFQGRSTLDGRVIEAIASFEWGAAVPVELLYHAIDRASKGLSIATFSASDLGF